MVNEIIWEDSTSKIYSYGAIMFMFMYSLLMLHQPIKLLWVISFSLTILFMIVNNFWYPRRVVRKYD